MIDLFTELLDYDRWANVRWIEALRHFDSRLVSAESMRDVALPGPWPYDRTGNQSERAQYVFAHIVWAERIWLERCGTAVKLPDANAENWLAAIHDGWRTEIQRHEPGECIDYQNTRGEPQHALFKHIFQHVMNHGTYHRGQLREILGAIPAEFPETDFISFTVTR